MLIHRPPKKQIKKEEQERTDLGKEGGRGGGEEAAEK